MSQSRLTKRWFHKFIDKFMPGNCRAALEDAFIQNSKTCAEMINYVNSNEHEIVAVMKNDRRIKDRRNDTTSLALNR